MARFMDEFGLRVPASTSNLGPKFDTFGLALPLYLSLKARRLTTGNDEFVFSGVDLDGEPADNENLFLRAYNRGLAAFASPADRKFGYRFEINNSIPFRRGLGSSGACVIAALLASVLVSGNLPPTDEQLLTLALEIEGHADNITPALLGGFTISLLVGEDFYCRQYPVLPALQALVIIPEFRLSTEESRKILPATVSLTAAQKNIARAALLLTALLFGDLTVLRPAVDDCLHQPYRQKLLPFFAPMVEISYRHGSLATFLSGSGSAFVCLVQENGRRLGEILCRHLKDDFAINGEYRLMTPDSRGALLKIPGDVFVPWKTGRVWLSGKIWPE